MPKQQADTASMIHNKKLNQLKMKKTLTISLNLALPLLPSPSHYQKDKFSFGVRSFIMWGRTIMGLSWGPFWEISYWDVIPNRKVGEGMQSLCLIHFSDILAIGTCISGTQGSQACSQATALLLPRRVSWTNWKLRIGMGKQCRKWLDGILEYAVVSFINSNC